MPAKKRHGDVRLTTGTPRKTHSLGADSESLRKDYDPARAHAEDEEREREVAEQVEAIRAEARRRQDEDGAS